MESYTTIEGHQNYPPQGGIYSNSENYDAGTTFNDEDERPAFWPPSIPGVLMILGIFLSSLNLLVGFITLIKLGAYGVHGGYGINVVNAGFAVGFLSFFYLIVAPAAVLAELKFPIVLHHVNFLKNNIGKGVFYFVWAMFTFGLAGDFGIAVASMLLFLSAANLAAGFLLKN